MHEFRVSLRLGKMVCMVSMVNQSIWKVLEVWNKI